MGWRILASYDECPTLFLCTRVQTHTRTHARAHSHNGAGLHARGGARNRIKAPEPSDTRPGDALRNVTAIFYDEDNGDLITGNTDGVVHVWSN